jgi:hypothetical protein
MAEVREGEEGEGKVVGEASRFAFFKTALTQQTKRNALNVGKASPTYIRKSA